MHFFAIPTNYGSGPGHRVDNLGQPSPSGSLISITSKTMIITFIVFLLNKLQISGMSSRFPFVEKNWITSTPLF